MKTDLMTLMVSLAILIITLLSPRTPFADAGAYPRYYFTAAMAISAAIATISALRLLLKVVRRPASLAKRPGRQDNSGQHRANYRLNYEAPPYPLFVETRDENIQTEAFSCPVKDISETGLSLLCEGVYSTGQIVQGEVIFISGRTARVNGSVIRKQSGRTSLALHCTIDPSIFMAEQREQIDTQKQSGPRPAVSQSALEKTADELPSHHPKGICRIK